MIIAAYLVISVCVLLLPRGISFSEINGALLKPSKLQAEMMSVIIMQNHCFNFDHKKHEGKNTPPSV